MKKKWTLPVWPETACPLGRAEGMLDGRLQYVARVQGVDRRSTAGDGSMQGSIPAPSAPRGAAQRGWSSSTRGAE